MASLLDEFGRQWDYLMTEIADERTKTWFLTGSPIPLLILLFIYYKVVNQIGPEHMKHRNAYNVDKIVQIYNLIQVGVCGWMAYEAFRITYGNGTYNWTCQPMDLSMSPHAVKVAAVTWMYYMIKIFDLMDTIFFVLRKKFTQVTFLHVYHHIGVALLGYIGCKYYPDGQGFLLIPLNCFVHTVMYAYYFLTNYDPEYKKKIWWKKYITQIQMIQFAILLFHMGKVLFMPSCEYPLIPVLLFLPQNTFVLFLFWNFYTTAYLKPVKSS